MEIIGLNRGLFEPKIEDHDRIMAIQVSLFILIRDYLSMINEMHNINVYNICNKYMLFYKKLAQGAGTGKTVNSSVPYTVEKTLSAIT